MAAEERAADRLDADERRREPPEQRPQAVGDPSRNLVGVQRLGDQPPDSREDLGFPLAASRLGVEPRVVERDRGLVDERLGEPDLVRSEDSTRAP